MKVYNYFRSGTSHRLRIVLNLKGLNWNYVAVDLRAEAHFDAAFKVLNPQGFVPTLVDGDLVLTQSPAIIEWLEERYPAPALLPANANDRARVRAMAALVGCDIHPLNNRRVLEYLRHTLHCDEAAVLAWCATSCCGWRPPAAGWRSLPATGPHWRHWPKACSCWMLGHVW